MTIEHDPVALKNGATHYTTRADDVTPQMYYKQVLEKYNDGTSAMVWMYFSSYKIWMGSSFNTHPEKLHLLKEIK